MWNPRAAHPAMVAVAAAVSLTPLAASAAPVTVSGAVQDSVGSAVAGATVQLQLRTGSAALATATTLGDGTFRITAEVGDAERIVCVAQDPRYFPQAVRIATGSPRCSFALEGLVTSRELVVSPPSARRGPTVAFTLDAPAATQLSDLAVRLRLAKPTSCGGDGATQRFDIKSTVVLSLTPLAISPVAAAVAAPAPTAPALPAPALGYDKSFTATGTAPLQTCSASSMALHIKPATPLDPGSYRITVRFPARFGVKAQRKIQRLMQFSPARKGALFESTVDGVDIELVTSSDNKIVLGAESTGSIPLSVVL
jgi:hypothetical protein